MCCRWGKEEGCCILSLVFSATDTRSPTLKITNWCPDTGTVHNINWCPDTGTVHNINSCLLVQVKQHFLKLKGVEILTYLSKLMMSVGRLNLSREGEKKKIYKLSSVYYGVDITYSV